VQENPGEIKEGGDKIPEQHPNANRDQQVRNRRRPAQLPKSAAARGPHRAN